MGLCNICFLILGAGIGLSLNWGGGNMILSSQFLITCFTFFRGVNVGLRSNLLVTNWVNFGICLRSDLLLTVWLDFCFIFSSCAGTSFATVARYFNKRLMTSAFNRFSSFPGESIFSMVSTMLNSIYMMFFQIFFSYNMYK